MFPHFSHIYRYKYICDHIITNTVLTSDGKKNLSDQTVISLNRKHFIYTLYVLTKQLIFIISAIKSQQVKSEMSLSDIQYRSDAVKLPHMT